MRHLYGTALASVMTVVMFFGGAWGYLRLLKLPVPPGDHGALPADGGSLISNGSVLLALAAVVATGVLAGILVAVPRISPLAAGLPGLLLIAWTILYLVSVRSATEFIPLRSHAFGAGWEALLFNGTLGAVGLAMIIPLGVPSRWRAPRRPLPPSRPVGGVGRPDAAGRPRREHGADTASHGLSGPPRAGGRRPAEPARPTRSARPAGSGRATGASRATGSFQAPTARGTGPIRTTGPTERVRSAGTWHPGVSPGSRPEARPASTPTVAPGPRTGPIRTSSPIRTTGPIRLNAPTER